MDDSTILIVGGVAIAGVLLWKFFSSPLGKDVSSIVNTTEKVLDRTLQTTDRAFQTTEKITDTVLNAADTVLTDVNKTLDIPQDFKTDTADPFMFYEGTKTRQDILAASRLSPFGGNIRILDAAIVGVEKAAARSSIRRSGGSYNSGSGTLISSSGQGFSVGTPQQANIINTQSRLTPVQQIQPAQNVYSRVNINPYASLK